MASLKERLLDYYDLNEEGYAALSAGPSFSSIPLFQEEGPVKAALQRIVQALNQQEKILVYGDYDCDGVMSTSIMTRTLRKLGARVSSYLPSRYLDGYGLSLQNAKKLPEAGYKLVITVDNGVSAKEPLEYLKSQGIDVIIIDHHEIIGELPPAVAVIHPTTLNYGPIPVSAGYLSFIFSVSLLKEKDDYLLSLGALSTLSDMMPLKGYNRTLVQLGLTAMNANHYPAISDFLEKSQIDEKSSPWISFRRSTRSGVSWKTPPSTA